MTIDNIVLNLTLNPTNREIVIVLLQTDIDGMEKNIEISYNIPISKKTTKEEKTEYTDRLKIYRGFYQEVLRGLIDSRY